MFEIESERALEPIVAHGSRMSWLGVLRPGDEFSRPVRSRLAVLTAESGPTLARYYGTWSERYRRFTTNVSSPRIAVRQLRTGQEPGPGLHCVLHWVKREDMVGSGPGSACRADAWPTELWQSFTSELSHLPAGTVAEKLRDFAESNLQEQVPIVKQWRAWLHGGEPRGEGSESSTEYGLIPVPATLRTMRTTRACIVSWSPTTRKFRSLSEALESPEGLRRKPDLRNQARYYLECVLAKHHGVRFGTGDSIEDDRFEQSSEYQEIVGGLMESESARLKDPAFGRFDRFGRT